MNLYRIISGNEWALSKKEGKVSRCNSDKRAGHVHLNKFEDIITVANKYFEPSEMPVVLEIEISAGLSEKLIWEQPTNEKNWEQANLQIKNININDVKRYSYLKFVGEDKFEIQEFTVLLLLGGT